MKKYKIGDIIYPTYQIPKKKWWQKTTWQVVTKEHPKYDWKSIRVFENYECAIIYSELLKLKEELKKKDENN